MKKIIDKINGLSAFIVVLIAIVSMIATSLGTYYETKASFADIKKSLVNPITGKFIDVYNLEVKVNEHHIQQPKDMAELSRQLTITTTQMDQLTKELGEFRRIFLSRGIGGLGNDKKGRNF